MVLVEYSDSEAESDQSSTPKDRKLHYDHAETPRLHKKLKLENNVGPSSTKADDKVKTAKPPPPLPSNFHSLYATNVRTSTTDDPSLHGGRKRQVAHVQGNWPSHTFLEWLPDKPHLQYFNDVISRVQVLVTAIVGDQPAPRANVTTESRGNSTTTETGTVSIPNAETNRLHTFLTTSLGARLPLHVSLSAPLVLTSNNKSAFHDEVVDAIQAAGTGPITIRLKGLDLVPNYEGSRWFLVARVTDAEGQGDGALMKLLTACNRVCREFGLATLYESSSGVGIETKDHGQAGREGLDVGANSIDEDAGNAFHISIAWTLKAPSVEVREAIPKIQLDGLGQEVVSFDRVKIKIGNSVDDIAL